MPVLLQFEDDEDAKLFVKSWLDPNKIEIIQTDKAEEILEQLLSLRSGNRKVIVLLDTQNYRDSSAGLRLAAKIKRLYPDQRVVGTSADSFNRKKYLEIGCEFISKFAWPDVLESTIFS